MTYTIRPLLPTDSASLRTMRLRVLKHYDRLFENLLRSEENKPESYWINLATERQDHCFFGLFHNKRLIGINAAKSWEKDERYAVGFSCFLLPNFRGRGLSHLLYEERMRWVQERGFMGFVAYILDDNIRARAIYEKKNAMFMYSETMSFDGGEERLFHWFFQPTKTEAATSLVA